MTKAEIVTLPETAMVTLWCRASEARRPDGIIDDPMAIRLVDSIDYDFSKFEPSPPAKTSRCGRLHSTRTPTAIFPTTRKPPSSPSAKDCRPASGASTLPASATNSAG